MPKPSPIYSHSNAVDVVSAFLEKHSRATYIFAKLNRLDVYKITTHLYNYYRYNQRKWYCVKKAIKELEVAPNYFANPEHLQEYLTFNKQNYPLLVLNLEKESQDGQLALDFCRIFEVDFITQEGLS